MPINSVICPSCGSVIQLASEMPFGYCKICGDSVKYSDAYNGLLSQSLLECDEQLNTMDANSLFIAAKAQTPFNKKLMLLASEKGFTDAFLYLAIEYYKSVSLSIKTQGIPLLEKAIKGGSVDAIVLHSIITYQTDISSDKDILLKNLLNNCDKDFKLDFTREDCNKYIKEIKKAIKNEKNVDTAHDNSSYNTYSSSFYPGMKYDPHGAGTFLDSRANLDRIVNDPSFSDFEKQEAIKAHNDWYLDHYGIY